MKIESLANIVNGHIVNSSFKNYKIGNIVIDSKKVSKKDVFIALKGKTFDGHDFVNEAIEKGAIAIIVSKEVPASNKTIVIKVDDTYETLLKLAEYQRNKYQVPLVAVTGSVGKTTTKELIASILNNKYQVLKR
ncbi:MAG: Mur ligase domain-containing protein, partial [Bacilli bacterium]|nr:Mur ligase domain-containing protein [Bacilli bacterium]